MRDEARSAELQGLADLLRSLREDRGWTRNDVFLNSGGALKPEAQEQYESAKMAPGFFASKAYCELYDLPFGLSRVESTRCYDQTLIDLHGPEPVLVLA